MSRNSPLSIATSVSARRAFAYLETSDENGVTCARPVEKLSEVAHRLARESTTVGAVPRTPGTGIALPGSATCLRGAPTVRADPGVSSAESRVCSCGPTSERCVKGRRTLNVPGLQSDHRRASNVPTHGPIAAPHAYRRTADGRVEPWCLGGRGFAGRGCAGAPVGGRARGCGWATDSVRTPRGLAARVCGGGRAGPVRVTANR